MGAATVMAGTVASMSELDMLLLHMRARGVHPSIRARVQRLNPDYAPGAMPRGIHYKRHMGPNCHFRYMSKGVFLKRHSRTAWDRLPREEIIKDGRRKWVRLEAVQDQLWLRR